MTTRVLHLVPIAQLSVGILRQLVDEQRVAAEEGLDWHVRIFTCDEFPDHTRHLRAEGKTTARPPRNQLRYGLDWIAFYHRLYAWLRANAAMYDVVALRYTVADIERWLAIRRLATPVVSVHHTLEVPELAGLPSRLSRARTVVERTVGGLNVRAAHGIVGVTDEIVTYESSRARKLRPAVLYPNCIDLGSHPVSDDARTDTIHVLFVASGFTYWQGLDRLITSIKTSDEHFVIDVVGGVSESLRKQAAGDSRIVFHGTLDETGMANIRKLAWVGLSSLALDRKGMTQACPLKVREYLASGIPVYAGHSDVFPERSPFYRHGTAQISSILKFACEARAMSRAEVRHQSSHLIDKRPILQRVYNDLGAIFSAPPTSH